METLGFKASGLLISTTRRQYIDAEADSAADGNGARPKKTCIDKTRRNQAGAKRKNPATNPGL
jgi:hypothetical protein